MKLFLAGKEIADIDTRKMKREPLTLSGLFKYPKMSEPSAFHYYYKCLCEVQTHLDRLSLLDAEFSMVCLTFGEVPGAYLKNDHVDQNCNQYFRKIN